MSSSPFETSPRLNDSVLIVDAAGCADRMVMLLEDGATGEGKAET